MVLNCLLLLTLINVFVCRFLTAGFKVLWWEILVFICWRIYMWKIHTSIKRPHTRKTTVLAFATDVFFLTHHAWLHKTLLTLFLASLCTHTAHREGREWVRVSVSEWERGEQLQKWHFHCHRPKLRIQYSIVISQHNQAQKKWTYRTISNTTEGHNEAKHKTFQGWQQPSWISMDIMTLITIYINRSTTTIWPIHWAAPQRQGR